VDSLQRIINLAFNGATDTHESFIDSKLSKIREIVHFNNKCIYSDLVYEKSPADFTTNDFQTLEILRGIRFWQFPFKLFKGYALMPFYSDFSGKINYRKDQIWKIEDPGLGFTCEFRIDSNGTYKNVYVLFFKRSVELQGNYYQFKNFVTYQIKSLFFDFLQYKSILGRAIFSTNSEIRLNNNGDWRLKEKIWNDGKGNSYKVTGLKYLYLKMGFELGELVDPSLEAQKDYVVLLNKNI